MIRKPNFFLIGPPRSGTTALWTYLKQHPDIYMPAKHKELMYFAKDLHPKRGTLKSYLYWFKDVKKEKCIGESTPFYLYSKTAAKEIKEFFPDSKIIITLRNPVDVMYSWYYFNLRTKTETESFKRALELIPKREKNESVPANAKSVRYRLYYKNLVTYSPQVKRYLNIFKKEKIIFIIFEDFKNNEKKIYKELLKFLDVNKSYVPNKFEKIKTNKVVRSKIIREIYSNRKIRKIAQKRLPLRIRKFCNTLKNINLKEEKRKPLDNEFKKKLMKEFIKDIDTLSSLIKKDLSFWYK